MSLRTGPYRSVSAARTALVNAGYWLSHSRARIGKWVHMTEGTVKAVGEDRKGRWWIAPYPFKRRP